MKRDRSFTNRYFSTNAAPSIGPVLGGVLAETVGWRWIFWLLSILSSLMLVCLILFFPETCRHLVHDGSVAATGVNMTLIAFLTRHSKNRNPHQAQQEKRQFHVPNPMAILTVLADRGSLFVIIVGSVVYTVFGCLGASLSAQCIELYDLDYLQAGLIYLPSGIGGILAAYTTGKNGQRFTYLSLFSSSQSYAHYS